MKSDPVQLSYATPPRRSRMGRCLLYRVALACGIVPDAIAVACLFASILFRFPDFAGLGAGVSFVLGTILILVGMICFSWHWDDAQGDPRSRELARQQRWVILALYAANYVLAVTCLAVAAAG
jgi:hypothetical protein